MLSLVRPHLEKYGFMVEFVAQMMPMLQTIPAYIYAAHPELRKE